MRFILPLVVCCFASVAKTMAEEGAARPSRATIATQTATTFFEAWAKEDLETVLGLCATPFGQEYENVYKTSDELRCALKEWFRKYDYTDWRFTFRQTLTWQQWRDKLPPHSKSKAWVEKLLDDDCYIVSFTFVTSRSQPDVPDAIQAWVRVKDGEAKVVGFDE